MACAKDDYRIKSDSVDMSAIYIGSNDTFKINDDLNYCDNGQANVTITFDTDVESILIKDHTVNDIPTLDELNNVEAKTLGICAHTDPVLDINDEELEDFKNAIKAEVTKECSDCYVGRPMDGLLPLIGSYEKNNYLATDGETIYKTVEWGTHDNGKHTFDVPKLNISSFSGCPHVYGKIYYKGVTYEIQQKITEKFLEDGKKTGGDWIGFKVGDFTQRFLDEESLNKAFELLKLMMN